MVKLKLIDCHSEHFPKSFLNVIITQAALLNAEQNAANVLGRRLNASVALVQALGGGWSTESLASR